MKIVIIGAGAIGTLLGVALHHAGNEITFIERSEKVETLKKNGLTLLWKGEKLSIANPEVLPAIDDIDLYELAIICVKSYATKELLHTLPQSTFRRLLTIQNGIGNEELFSQKFSPERVISGAITLPVAVLGDGSVEVTNVKGGIALAPVDEESDITPIVSIFSESVLPTMYIPDYRSMKWSKLILNIIGNPISAITELSMPKIFQSRKLVILEKAAVSEAVKVMRASGIQLTDLPAYPVHLTTMMMRFFFPTLVELIVSALSNKYSRGSKMPSLYIDLKNGSKRSEVEMLNGAIAQQGEKVGVPTPVNRFLSEMLQGIVAGEIDPEPFRKNPDSLYDEYESVRDICQ